MAIQGTALEFDEEVSQTDRLLSHNQALRDHIKVVQAIKEAIEYDEIEEAALMWFNMPVDARDALWVAPTKGGIFTTAEREIIKTTEFREAYYQPEEKA